MNCLNIHHVGLWVYDVDEMAAFLTGVMGLRLLNHAKWETGERLFFHAGDNQLIEVLWRAEKLPRPDVPYHMERGGKGAVVGIPHLCLRVMDLPAWESKIRALNYTINFKSPDNDTEYIKWELGKTRAFWFTGPSGFDIELFEFEEEFPFSDLPK